MKNNILLVILLGACVWFGCSKPKTMEPLDDNTQGFCKVIEMPSCDSVFCTLNSVSVKVDIVDSLYHPVMLDSFYVTDMAGNKLPSDLYGYDPASKNYMIFNDSWVAGHQKTFLNMRVIGFVHGNKVVDEPYGISTDCCHVNKTGGNSRIIVR